MFAQYLQIKEQYPDCILFYRLGDFYETFMDDAELVARELELVLTGREAGKGMGRVPMAGIPYHTAEGYIARLIEKGYKVAICEQLEDPKKAKGLVKRDVTRVVTPGTLVSPVSSPRRPTTSWPPLPGRGRGSAWRSSTSPPASLRRPR